MATYVYNCTNKNCKKYKIKFEKKQSMKEDKLKVCKHSEEESLERIPCLNGFTMKGIGLYKNKTY